MVTEVMRDIINVQKGEDGFLEQAKILVISHDISFYTNEVCITDLSILPVAKKILRKQICLTACV